MPPPVRRCQHPGDAGHGRRGSRPLFERQGRSGQRHRSVQRQVDGERSDDLSDAGRDTFSSSSAEREAMAPDRGCRCQVRAGVACQRSTQAGRSNALADISHRHCSPPRPAEHMARVHGTRVACSGHTQVGTSVEAGRNIGRTNHAKQITAARRGQEAHCRAPGTKGPFHHRVHRTACTQMSARSLTERRMLSFGRFSGRAPFVQWPRTPAFHAGNTGSNPVRGATARFSLLDSPDVPKSIDSFRGPANRR